MKIKVDKIYVTANKERVAIIAINPYDPSEFIYIGSILDDNDRQTATATFAEDGSSKYGTHNLVKEFQRPMRAPETVTPLYGEEYYIPGFYTTNKVLQFTWQSDVEDITAFHNGIVFLEEEDAQAATEILIDLFKEYVCQNF